MNTNTDMNENFNVFVYPLNNIYCYDFNYSASENHIENFIEIVTSYSDYPQTEEKLLKTVIDFFNLNKQNSKFLDYVTSRIQIVPYILKEFLHVMKEIKIKIKLVIRSKLELEVTKLECELLNINDYVEIIENSFNDKSIVISDKISDLENLKCLTIFNFLILNDTEEYLAIQKRNTESLTKFYPDLIIESLRQANILIEFVKKNDNCSIEQIRSEFFSNSLKVVYIFDSKSSAKNYRKRELATSSARIKYTPFITKNFGLDDSLSVYRKIDVFVQRCPYLYFTNASFCKNLQQILDSFHKEIVVVHDMKVIETCFNRFNVYNFIKGFVSQVESRIYDQFHIKLNVPFTVAFSIEKEDSVEKVKEVIKSKIKENEVIFPLVIKPDACTEHEMFLILNEEGLDNFINKDNEEKRKKSKEFVIQKFVSHGGLMFKNYYINNKTFTITRPSLPDLKGETLKLDHFKQGCFKFYNEFLYKKEDPTFWKGIEKEKDSEGELSVNLEALDLLSKLLAETKNITLFGLDYLFDRSTNTYYILEINYFPSYRELGSKLRDEFEEHFISLYNKMK